MSMTSRFSVTLGLIILTLLPNFIQTKIDPDICNIHIRVLLGEISTSEKTSWSIAKKESNKQINISFKNNNIYTNDKKVLRNSLRINPDDGHLSLNGKEYQGTFHIIRHKKKLLLINALKLEDYIFSVLKTESWPGWPLEVNKVFAIASRSYAIAKVLENKKTKLPYHIKNTNKHQTYHGVHNCKILKQAVEETKNIVLGNNKKPILAMFDCCCGGIIPAHMKSVDFKKAPYLARKRVCSFCKPCKIFSWEVSYNKKELIKILKKEFPNLKNIRSIKVTKKDPAGIVKVVEIVCNNLYYHVSGKKLYSLLKDITSFCFSINKQAEKIIIKGRGFGHHLGLCQWGAREMIKQSWDYQSILKFYYPGATFMKLKKK